jgi:hypothetical protein
VKNRRLCCSRDEGKLSKLKTLGTQTAEQRKLRLSHVASISSAALLLLRFALHFVSLHLLYVMNMRRYRGFHEPFLCSQERTPRAVLSGSFGQGICEHIETEFNYLRENIEIPLGRRIITFGYISLNRSVYGET